MDFKIIIKPVVYWDIQESISWYEQQVPGLGRRFLIQLEEAKNRISANPASFSFLKDPVRKCKINKFPYLILFTIQDKAVHILGITSTRRSDAFLEKRLRFLA